MKLYQAFGIATVGIAVGVGMIAAGFVMKKRGVR